MIPPCLTPSNKNYVSRVNWSNPGKGVAPSPTPRCSSYWKGSLLVTLDDGRHLHFYFTIICIYWLNKKILTGSVSLIKTFFLVIFLPEQRQVRLLVHDSICCTCWLFLLFFSLFFFLHFLFLFLQFILSGR